MCVCVCVAGIYKCRFILSPSLSLMLTSTSFHQASGCEGIMKKGGYIFFLLRFFLFFDHGRGDRCDRTDGPLDLDTRVWVCVVRVTLLGARLCLCE